MNRLNAVDVDAQRAAERNTARRLARRREYDRGFFDGSNDNEPRKRSTWPEVYVIGFRHGEEFRAAEMVARASDGRDR